MKAKYLFDIYPPAVQKAERLEHSQPVDRAGGMSVGPLVVASGLPQAHIGTLLSFNTESAASINLGTVGGETNDMRKIAAEFRALTAQSIDAQAPQ